MERTLRSVHLVALSSDQHPAGSLSLSPSVLEKRDHLIEPGAGRQVSALLWGESGGFFELLPTVCCPISLFPQDSSLPVRGSLINWSKSLSHEIRKDRYVGSMEWMSSKGKDEVNHKSLPKTLFSLWRDLLIPISLFSLTDLSSSLCNSFWA